MRFSNDNELDDEIITILDRNGNALCIQKLLDLKLQLCVSKETFDNYKNTAFFTFLKDIYICFRTIVGTDKAISDKSFNTWITHIQNNPLQVQHRNILALVRALQDAESIVKQVCQIISTDLLLFVAPFVEPALFKEFYDGNLLCQRAYAMFMQQLTSEAVMPVFNLNFQPLTVLLSKNLQVTQCIHNSSQSIAQLNQLYIQHLQSCKQKLILLFRQQGILKLLCNFFDPYWQLSLVLLQIRQRPGDETYDRLIPACHEMFKNLKHMISKQLQEALVDPKKSMPEKYAAFCDMLDPTARFYLYARKEILIELNTRLERSAQPAFVPGIFNNTSPQAMKIEMSDLGMEEEKQPPFLSN